MRLILLPLLMLLCTSGWSDTVSVSDLCEGGNCVYLTDSELLPMAEPPEVKNHLLFTKEGGHITYIDGYRYTRLRPGDCERLGLEHAWEKMNFTVVEGMGCKNQPYIRKEFKHYKDAYKLYEELISCSTLSIGMETPSQRRKCLNCGLIQEHIKPEARWKELREGK